LILAATQEDALGGLRHFVDDVARELADTTGPVPEPPSSRPYSGTFNLRVGEQLHRRLAMQAAEEDHSLNQSVVRRLTHAS
jgi:predicted HicB family RNase H-like nuclease